LAVWGVAPAAAPLRLLLDVRLLHAASKAAIETNQADLESLLAQLIRTRVIGKAGQKRLDIRFGLSQIAFRAVHSRHDSLVKLVGRGWFEQIPRRHQQPGNGQNQHPRLR